MINWERIWSKFEQATETEDAYSDPIGFESLAYNWPKQRELIQKLVEKEVQNAN